MALLPASQMRENASWRLFETAGERVVASHPSSQHAEKLAIGAVAGAVSKTVVAPVERCRELAQASAGASKGLFAMLAGIVRNEGAAQLWRGNGLSLLKIVPYVALQFTLYDAAKDALSQARGQLGVVERVAAGVMAGGVASLVTYPFDCLKTQISAGGLKGSLPQVTRKVVARLGVGGLYQGLMPSLGINVIGTAIGFNIMDAMADAYRDSVARGRHLTALETAFLGGISGICCAGLSLPFYTSSARLRVQGLKGWPVRYEGMNHCIATMVRTEGVRSLYRGAVPLIVKIFPQIGIIYYITEALRRHYGVSGLSVYEQAAGSTGRAL